MQLTMSSWVASLVLASVLGSRPATAPERQEALSSHERDLWQQVLPSVLFLNQFGAAKGSAVCISPTGYFLTHRSSIYSGQSANSPQDPEIFGVASSGHRVRLHLIAQDKPTGLALLEAEPEKTGYFRAIRLADEAHAKDSSLLVVLPTGPVRADIGHGDILATVAGTNQTMAVNEIRFDAPSQLLAGGLLFDDRGDLVGVLGATLPRSMRQGQLSQTGQIGQAQGGQAQAGPAVGSGFAAAGKQASPHPYGLSGLNVAYAVSPLILERVVAGFLSPSHEVKHPALGALCSDFILADGQRGARIERIVKGSAAAKGGLRIGDVILNIEGTPINDQLDYARAMLSQVVGQKVTLAIRRDGDTMPIDVVVGEVNDGAEPGADLVPTSH